MGGGVPLMPAISSALRRAVRLMSEERDPVPSRPLTSTVDGNVGDLGFRLSVWLHSGAFHAMLRLYVHSSR